MALSEHLEIIAPSAGAGPATALLLSDGCSKGAARRWQQLTDAVADGVRVCLSVQQAEQQTADAGAASLAFHTASVAAGEGAGLDEATDAAVNTAGPGELLQAVLEVGWAFMIINVWKRYRNYALAL